jgi:hypothetical protein
MPALILLKLGVSIVNTKKIIIKFEQVCDQTNHPIRRLVGFVKAKYLVDLIDATNLDANPRSAKVGSVTEDIIESIKKTKDIFPFKTKGILLAASNPPRDLERKRYELEFQNDEIEGILDGGHNTLAIAIHILNLATEDDRAVRKIKRWSDLKDVWNGFRDKISDIINQLDFLVPVEILVPIDDSEEVIEDFRNAILDICSARNNNVQLAEEALANHAGHYDFIREVIDPKLKEQIIWKTNDPGRIPVRDIISLAWIPLSLIDLPAHLSKFAPYQLYSSKGKCSEAFNELMKDPEISMQEGSRYELKNPTVGSALNLLKDIPMLYDLIYTKFPDCYNKYEGKFGRILSVKKYDPKKYNENPKGGYLKNRPVTPFYAKEVDYEFPDGFITPLVYALSALMEVKNSMVKWKVDPFNFLEKNLNLVVKDYKGLMKMANWDPQTFGKNSSSYSLAKQSFAYFLY